jgi:membrane fusion protein (multidrug efflux system)
MAKEHETPESGKKKPNRVLPIILGIILVAGIIFGIKEYIYYGKHVDTDDAQIDGDISPVVARVGGYVDSILFQENTHVNKGQLLVKIDDRDYRVKLEQALTARTGASQGVNVGESQIYENAANTSTALKLNRLQHSWTRYLKITHVTPTWCRMDQSRNNSLTRQRPTWKPRRLTIKLHRTS